MKMVGQVRQSVGERFWLDYGPCYRVRCGFGISRLGSPGNLPG